MSKKLKSTLLDQVGDTAMDRITPKQFDTMGVKRIRENAQEFGGVATAGAAYRDVLAPSFYTIGDSKISTRFKDVVFKTMKRGDNERGQREINPLANQEMYTGFEFNQQNKVTTVFSVPCNMLAAADRKSVTLEVPPFDPGNLADPPKGATHLRILVQAGYLPVFNYSPLEDAYVSEDTAIEFGKTQGFSDYLDVFQVQSNPISVVANFPGDINPKPETALAGCYGIEFYQEVNSRMYKLQSKRCMKIYMMF